MMESEYRKWLEGTRGMESGYRKWAVFLDGKWIDTVFFLPDCDKDYVLNSLINHDGFHPNIVIK